MIFTIGKYAYVLNKVNFGQGSASVKFDSITVLHDFIALTSAGNFIRS